MVGRHEEGDAGGVRVADERGEELVVGAENRAGTRVVHRVSCDIRLEKLVEGKVVGAGDAEEVVGGILRGDGGDVGVAVLDRLAGEILHESLVVREVVDGGDGLRRGEGHDGGDRLEAARDKLVRGVHEIGVGELDALSARLERKKEVVVLDLLSEGRARKAFAVPPHEDRSVDAGEHGGLSGCRLRQPIDGETGIDRDAMALDQAA